MKSLKSDLPSLVDNIDENKLHKVLVNYLNGSDLSNNRE